jgi:hypothetical protein
MDNEPQTKPQTPVPVGTLYMHGDGNFSIQSSLSSPRDLARVLSELTSNIISQLTDPALPEMPKLEMVPAPVDAPAETPADGVEAP